ncbi:MAG: hypothetical protein Q7U16_01910 [Agitococcus sp.]|nr:hypothetical protein [Agitococcus sp.]
MSPRKALSLGHYDQETSVIGEGTSPSNNILNPNLNEEAFYDFIYRVSKPISSEMILGSLGGDQLNVPTVDLRTDSLVNKEGKKLPMIDLPTHGLRMVANSGGIHGYSCAWPAKFSLKKIISSRGPFVCGWLNGPQAKVDIDMMYFGVDSTSRVVVRIHDNKLVDGKPVPHPQPFDTYKTYLAIFKFITSTRNP